MGRKTGPERGYGYDGNNNRLQQIAYGGGVPVTTTYTNDIIGLAQVLVSDNGLTTTHMLFGQDLILQDDGTETRILLADGLGSTRTEMVGSQVETTTTYEPYGKLLVQSGSSGTVYGYTGEAHDASTGLLFLRARYYSPYLNRFLSRDPFPGYATLPVSQNGYNYVHANPVNYIDPSGECYGPVRFLRQLETTNCTNQDLAWSIVTNPNASIGQRLGAATYTTVMGGSHIMLGTGLALSGGFGQGLVAYTAGYGGYDHLREQTNSPWVTIPGYILGYENIHRDLITLNDPCASTAQRILAVGDATLNTVLGASGIAGAANGVRSVKTAWQLRNLSPAARLAYLQNLAAKSGVELIESNRFYRELGKRVIEYPVQALDDSWRLSGGFYHELAHVGQEFGRASTLRGGELVTKLPKGLQWLSTKLERGIGILAYPLNPVEAHAFASGIAYSQNVGYLVYSKILLYGVNDYSGSSNNN